ncbi:MAG: sigma 54-interacting transcriptional regulator [Deltaproteobacteria bacterium]|nr:sigma 54-interacting transcriptional regulator [Deltaproteobacteria bacterium]
MHEEKINQYLKEILNTMNDGLMVASPDGTILMVNQAFEQIMGYRREEIIGRPCTILKCDICSTARSKGTGSWCDLFEQGKATRKRCLYMRKDGTYVPILKNAAILRDEAGQVLGAVETLTDISELARRDEEIQQLAKLVDAAGDFHGMVGKSPRMQQVFDLTQKAAQSEAPVIIFGESGTGKELLAHAIHALGRRREGPFITCNCAALNESLLESELFGHVKGAFTGAYTHRQGRFEAANRGDIFLDEVGDIPPAIQVKLLRVLETKQFERVGESRSITTDVRIITATHRNLEALVSDGKFRGDLFFRINVIPIHLPPLRERLEDVPLLVEHFLQRLRRKSGKEIAGLTKETMKIFLDYPWPGNIRELQGALEYAFVVAETGLIAPGHLPPKLSSMELTRKTPPETLTVGAGDEKTALVNALRQTGGNQSHAAALLGVSRVTVWHRMKKYGIDVHKLITA